jgi:hypothetical protein
VFRRCVRISPSLPLVGLLLGLSLGACVGPQRTTSAPTAAPTSLPAVEPTAGPDGVPAVVGTWDSVFHSITQQGDRRIEQEEWRLELDRDAAKSGAAVPLRGEYLREVLTLSADQQPFRCNGRPGFLTRARVRLAGHAAGDEVVLRELSREAPREPPADPCTSGEPPLTAYTGRLAGDTLRLTFGDGAVQHLSRRPPGRLAPPLALRDPAAASPDATRADGVTGTWLWQHRSEDREGDIVLEEERWQLSERAGAESSREIEGSYERTLTRTRPPERGRFRCNGQSQIRTVTRFTLRGQRFGQRLSLSELTADSQRGPCDNGQRRLDHYQGTLLPDGTLLLGTGNGHQLLRRAP